MDYELYVSPETVCEMIGLYVGDTDADWFKSVSETEQRRFILAAMSIIDAFRYRGRKAGSEQLSAFPRIIDGRDTGIPKQIRFATLQLIGELVKGSSSRELSELRMQGISSYQLDDFHVQFAAVKQIRADNLRSLPNGVYQLLEPYLLRGGIVSVTE